MTKERLDISLVSKEEGLINPKGKGVDLRIYTSSISMGFLNGESGKGLSSWGFIVHGISTSRESEWTRYGSMPSANNEESAAFAVLQGFKQAKFPANVTVHTNNPILNNHLITCFREGLDGLRDEIITPSYKNILNNILNEIEDNKNILSLDLNLLKHPKDLGRDAENTYNKKSFDQAMDGIPKGVRNLLWNIKHLKEKNNPEAYQDHLNLCHNNFESAPGLVNIAVQYMREKPGFITSNEIYQILPEEDADNLVDAWNVDHDYDADSQLHYNLGY